MFNGWCQLGRIALDAEGELVQAMECNASHGLRKGTLPWFVPRKKLRLVTPESGLATAPRFVFDGGSL